MRLKSIPLRLEDQFLSTRDVEAICQEVTLDQPDRLIVAIDGAPGVGKSVLGKALAKRLADLGIPSNLIATDLDFIPRPERPANTDLMDWVGPDGMVREVITHPGAQFPYLGYDVIKKDRSIDAKVASPKSGVLVLEGIGSIEHALDFCQARGDSLVVAVEFQIPEEVREINRMERNVRIGRWSRDEAMSRTEAQRANAVSYYGDLSRTLAKTSAGIQNTIRAFMLN